LPAPLLYLRPELLFEELLFEELFFADDFFEELRFVEDFFEPLAFLPDDFLLDDFFLLLAFLVAIWILPPVMLERDCLNFVASQDLRSSNLILLCDGKSTLRAALLATPD
jgi:hypothetical protein